LTEAVIDASAFLAYLYGEPGADRVEDALARGARISAVNWSEVLGKAADAGERVERDLRKLLDEQGVGQLLEVVPFGRDDAERAAALRRATRQHGLSLGDRACLALGWRLGAPVLTADRAWLDLEIPVEVVGVR
jgi:ribonuclease VapC